MNYQEFKDYIGEHIKEHLPAEYQDSEISFLSVTKNNNTKREGLQIRKEKESITPCIYMDNFFENCQNGTEIDSIMKDIAAVFVSTSNQGLDFAFNINQISDFNSVRNRIMCRLINKDNNSEILAKVPYTPLENLAVTYQIMVSNQNNSLNTITISNKMLKDYDVSVDELHKTAIRNMDYLMPPRLESMSDMLHRLAPPGMGIPMGDTTDSMPVYILTNEIGVYGASVLLNPSFMDEVTKELGKDLIVLPSSVHEVIILPNPDSEEDDIKELEDMVKEINGNFLNPEEFLSDSVYEYHAENHCFLQCNRSAQEQTPETNHEPKQKADKQNPIKAHAKSAGQISPQEEITM